MSATIRPATMKGPAIFLAQFIGDAPPFDSFDAICGWAAGLGYKGVQVPTSDPRLIDIDKAAASQAYCDEIAGVAASHGLVITELSTHLPGQLSAPAAEALGLVLQLGQLDLRLALLGLRVLREDIQDQRGPVDHLDLEPVLQVA